MDFLRLSTKTLLHDIAPSVATTRGNLKQTNHDQHRTPGALHPSLRLLGTGRDGPAPSATAPTRTPERPAGPARGSCPGAAPHAAGQGLGSEPFPPGARTPRRRSPGSVPQEVSQRSSPRSESGARGTVDSRPDDRGRPRRSAPGVVSSWAPRGRSRAGSGSGSPAPVTWGTIRRGRRAPPALRTKEAAAGSRLHRSQDLKTELCVA